MVCAGHGPRSACATRQYNQSPSLSHVCQRPRVPPPLPHLPQTDIDVAAQSGVRGLHHAGTVHQAAGNRSAPHCEAARPDANRAGFAVTVEIRRRGHFDPGTVADAARCNPQTGGEITVYSGYADGGSQCTHFYSPDPSGAGIVCADYAGVSAPI